MATEPLKAVYNFTELAVQLLARRDAAAFRGAAEGRTGYKEGAPYL